MGLIVFQLKLYTLSKIKYLNILQLYVTYLSLQECFLYTILKTAKVISIHKKDSRLEVSNNRPISLLSSIDKFFKKLMHSRLTEFLGERQILYYKQFGFQKGFWTNHAILNLLEIIEKALDHEQIACGIYRPWKSIWHCESWHSTWQTRSLWY